MLNCVTLYVTGKDSEIDTLTHQKQNQDQDPCAQLLKRSLSCKLLYLDFGFWTLDTHHPKTL